MEKLIDTLEKIFNVISEQNEWRNLWLKKMSRQPKEKQPDFIKVHLVNKLGETKNISDSIDILTDKIRWMSVVFENGLKVVWILLFTLVLQLFAIIFLLFSI